MAGFKNLEDLVGALEGGLRKLRAGELEPEELTPLVADARELCDRLILLRFKAHEFSYEVRRKGPQGGVDEAAADRKPVRPFRIGAAYQTSLIDAIEEVSREQADQERLAAGTPGLFDPPMDEPLPTPVHPESTPEAEVDVPRVEVAPEPVSATAVEPEPDPAPSAVTDPEPSDEVEDPAAEEEEVSMPSPHPTDGGMTPGAGAAPESVAPAPSAPSASLAEQMERKPLDNLRTAFSLVEKYECIKMLFADDAGEFNRVLDALEEAGTFELAVHWLGQHVEAFGEWDKEDPVVIRFLDRIERRYL